MLSTFDSCACHQALDFCHSQGVMHRDVKPGNGKRVVGLPCSIEMCSSKHALHMSQSSSTMISES